MRVSNMPLSSPSLEQWANEGDYAEIDDDIRLAEGDYMEPVVFADAIADPEYEEFFRADGPYAEHEDLTYDNRANRKLTAWEVEQNYGLKGGQDDDYSRMTSEHVERMASATEQEYHNTPNELVPLVLKRLFPRNGCRPNGCLLRPRSPGVFNAVRHRATPLRLTLSRVSGTDLLVWLTATKIKTSWTTMGEIRPTALLSSAQTARILGQPTEVGQWLTHLCLRQTRNLKRFK